MIKMKVDLKLSTKKHNEMEKNAQTTFKVDK